LGEVTRGKPNCSSLNEPSFKLVGELFVSVVLKELCKLLWFVGIVDDEVIPTSEALQIGLLKVEVLPL